MQILIVYISDIHLSEAQPENEGLVLNAFIKDMDRQLKLIPHDDVFVFIGGDLVQDADNATSYHKFLDSVILPIISLGIIKEHIICVPGNHDIQRSWINKHEAVYASILEQTFSDNEFNNLFEDEDDARMLIGKFDNFSTFVNSSLDISTYDPKGYHVEIGENWSLYCLNSSLTSFGGIGYAKKPLLKEDKGRLNIYTRGLYDWVQHNQKHKILMLHHPFEFLQEDMASELTKIVKTNIDLILTGHTHDQDIFCNMMGSDSFVWCKAPQLYTSKNDDLGYCIIKIVDNELEEVIYREWFPKRNAFRQGIDFTTEENGIVKIPKRNAIVTDRLSVQFEDIYQDVMAVYNGQPVKWIDRYFSHKRFDRSYKFDYKNLISEEQLLESNHNFKIIAPKQYGLTAWGWHFIYKRIWLQKKEFGLYLDAGHIRKDNLSNLIDCQLNKFKVCKSDVKRIIIDNWNLSEKSAKSVLTFLSQEYTTIPVIILCPQLEHKFVENEYVSVSEFGYQTLFMAPIQMGQIRSLIELYGTERHLAQDTDIVLKKLNDDIQDFNMHRTPLNCITLLEVFCKSFDDNPVNRTAVLEKVLSIIFDSENVPTYKSLPDIKDCEFALGYFCEGMLRNNQYNFSNNDFVREISDFCAEQKLSIDVSYLFDVLLHNNIICQYSTDFFAFRFSYWVYYFAAMRMTKSPHFAAYILSDENYVHFPEVIEFYTGSDRTRNDAADKVINDINHVAEKVHDKVGLDDGFNPLEHLKLKPSNAQIEKALQQLDANLQHSKLPNDIKDAMADKDYNPSKPYHQSVYKIFENYSVNYLQELIAIASKTLRNSDYISPDRKDKLMKAITNAWLNIVRVITLMAPALSRDGQAKFDGFSLALADGFECFKNDPKETLIRVISAIPENLVKWYKDDIYSSKLSRLFFDTISSERNPIIRHLLITMIMYEQPDKWGEVVKKYLSMVGYNSYYFGDAMGTLEYLYKVGNMSDNSVNRTKGLIILGYTKMYSNDHKIHPEQIRKYVRILPQRTEKTSDE